MSPLKKYVPILDWLPKYERKNLKGDIFAGLTVGIMLIPQGMAYALLAGLPPVHGLYASIIPLIFYAIFGTSRQLGIGPAALDSLLIASGIGVIAETGSAVYMELTVLLAFMVGALQVVFGILKLGFLVNFLSKPVISGFTSGAALIIGLNQLKYLTALDIPRDNHIYNIIGHAIVQAKDIHVPTLILGLAGIVIIVVSKKIHKQLPGPLIAVFFAIAAVYFLDLEEEGIAILKDIPNRLPTLSTPQFDLKSLQQLYPLAFALALMGYMETIAIGKSMQAIKKDYEIAPNQELIALGAANISASLFKAFPIAASFSRSAVNEQAGANTSLSTLISAVLVSITLMFLTPMFYYLPETILASVIMASVFGLIKIKDMTNLWDTDRRDFFMLITTFIATLLLNVQLGIGLGVVLSLGMVIFRSTYPHMAVLGKVPGTNQYRNIRRFKDAVQQDDVLIVRFDAQLFFANVAYFKDRLHQMEKEKKTDVRFVVINAEAINAMDSSATNALNDLIDDYRQRGVDLYLADVKGPIRDILFRAGLVDKLGAGNFFMDTEEALDHAERIRKQEKTSISKHALQTNVNKKK